MFKRLLLVCLLPVVISAQPALIDSTVMPFGGYARPNGYSSYFDSDMLIFMHDSLGINQHHGGGFNTRACSLFAYYGIYPYPSGGYFVSGPAPDTFDIQARYARSIYYICHPEDNSVNVRFRSVQGAVVDSYLVYDGSGYMLNELTLTFTAQCLRRKLSVI